MELSFFSAYNQQLTGIYFQSAISYTEEFIDSLLDWFLSVKYLHEGMDIRSFFGARTSSSVGSSSTHTEKGSNCSDLNSDITEPPSKKVCRVLIQPLTMMRKYSKNGKNEFSWQSMKKT